MRTVRYTVCRHAWKEGVWQNKKLYRQIYV